MGGFRGSSELGRVYGGPCMPSEEELGSPRLSEGSPDQALTCLPMPDMQPAEDRAASHGECTDNSAPIRGPHHPHL